MCTLSASGIHLSPALTELFQRHAHCMMAVGKHSLRWLRRIGDEATHYFNFKCTPAFAARVQSLVGLCPIVCVVCWHDLVPVRSGLVRRYACGLDGSTTSRRKYTVRRVQDVLFGKQASVECNAMSNGRLRKSNHRIACQRVCDAGTVGCSRSRLFSDLCGLFSPTVTQQRQF